MARFPTKKNSKELNLDTRQIQNTMQNKKEFLSLLTRIYKQGDSKGTKCPNEKFDDDDDFWSSKNIEVDPFKLPFLN